jgi:hypothetical protein
VVPVRISARSLGPRWNAATVTSWQLRLKMPGIASLLLLPENQAEHEINQRQAVAEA